jgi:hypothetical protein
VISISLFALIVIGLVFLVLREWICWYAKINERILLQERTNELLEAILEGMGEENAPREEIVAKRSNAKISVKKESGEEMPETAVLERGNKIITINL